MSRHFLSLVTPVLLSKVAPQTIYVLIPQRDGITGRVFFSFRWRRWSKCDKRYGQEAKMGFVVCCLYPSRFRFLAGLRSESLGLELTSE